jgi:putative PIN family toxin of toxin-antitoxin system
MSIPQIVIDTNVIVAALRSRRGASHRLLRLIDSGKFEINISVPLVLEYEDAGKRILDEIGLREEDIEDVIDYICKVANHHKIYYLWRPFLRDPKDDMVLELAVSGSCEIIVTYNVKDFGGVEEFGLKVMTAVEFLEQIGELK